jgi:hypothetical protein
MEGRRHGHAAQISTASSVAAPGSSSSGSPPRSLKGSGHGPRAKGDYVRAVLDCYLWLPGTGTVTSRHDRRCARVLYTRGVPLELVKAAMLTAVARRTFRRGDPLPRIRALHFFLPVIDELLEVGVDVGYVQYLEFKLQPLAAQKRDTLRVPTMGSG